MAGRNGARRQSGGARGRARGARGVVAGLCCAVAIFGAAVPALADEPDPTLVVALTTIRGGEQAGAGSEPTLLVYSDGHAVHSPDAADPKRPADRKPEQRKGHVPLDTVRKATAAAKDLAEVDLGMPGNGNGGSTLLDVLGESPDQDVHLVVYSPGGTDGLNDAQKDGRQRFDALRKKLVDAFDADR